jgi:hypothetical protein
MQLNTRIHAALIIGGAFFAFAPFNVALADATAAKPVEPPPAAATSSGAAKAAPAAAAKSQAPRKLDLKAPPLNRVFSQNQIQTLTNRPEEIGEDADTVSVKGARHDRPNVPSGFAGMGWAIRHPTQAWRLFVPAPSD